MAKKLRLLYFYLYYRLYTFSKWMGHKDAHWVAMFMISVPVFFNVITLLSLFSHADKVFSIAPKVIGGIIIIIIGAANYYVFIAKSGYLKVIRYYKSENNLKKRLSIILSVIYVILSIAIAHLI